MKREQPEIHQISYSIKADYQNMIWKEAFTSTLRPAGRLTPVNNYYSGIYFLYLA
jgi:hypothetical protein